MSRQPEETVPSPTNSCPTTSTTGRGPSDVDKRPSRRTIHLTGDGMDTIGYASRRVECARTHGRKESGSSNRTRQNSSLPVSDRNGSGVSGPMKFALSNST